MIAPAGELACREVGAVRCVRCKQWRPLFEKEQGGPALAICCDHAYLVQPDGTPEVYDLGADDEAEPAEDCA